MSTTASEPVTTPAEIKGEGLLLGWDTSAAGECRPILHGDEGHLMTFAPTGAGKGVSCVIPALLRHRGQAIVIDPKGECHAITAAHRRAMGQQVYVLDPYGITGDTPATLNPFDLLPASADEAAAHLPDFAELLCHKLTNPEDPMWGEGGRSITIALLQHYLESEPDAKARTLLAFRHFAARAMTPSFAKQMAESRFESVRRQAPVIRGQADHQGSSHDLVAHALSELDGLSGSVIARATASTTIPIEALQQGDPLTLYLVVPPDRLRPAARLLRLWLGLFAQILLKRTTRPQRSTLLLVDEAAQLGPLGLLVDAMTLYRSYGLQCWTIWQDLSQLQHTYPNHWRTLLNNTAVVQTFGIGCHSLAEQMAWLLPASPYPGPLGMKPHRMLLALSGEKAREVQRGSYLTDSCFNPGFGHDPPGKHRKNGAAALMNGEAQQPT